MIYVPRLFGESDEAYHGKRLNVVSVALKGVDRWSEIGCYVLSSWIEHMYRHPLDPPFRSYATQNNEWLRQRRAAHASHSGVSIEAGRTYTRQVSGFPNRFQQRVFDKIDFNNPDKNKSKTKSNANLLHVFVMDPSLYK